MDEHDVARCTIHFYNAFLAQSSPSLPRKISPFHAIFAFPPEQFCHLHNRRQRRLLGSNTHWACMRAVCTHLEMRASAQNSATILGTHVIKNKNRD